MSDIFISYKREDAHAVERLVQALRASGFVVWWDQDIAPEAPWEASIESALHQAKVVIVAWSPASVTSENVKAEARWARNQGRLLQAFVKPATPPLFFGERQGIDLSAWRGDPNDRIFYALVEGARAILTGKLPAAGLGHTPRPKRFTVAYALIGLVAFVAVAVAGVQFWQTSKQTQSETDRLLSAVPGVWGPPGCAERGTYSVEGRRIIARWPKFESVGQVVSSDGGALLSETLLPLDRRGRLVELRPHGDRLVVHDRTDNVQVVLEKCV